MQTTINAQTIINTVTAAAAIAPEFNESERVQNEFHHSARYMRVYFDDETPPAVTNAARAEAYSEFLRCNPTPPPKIKIQTSARGYMTIQNTRERLEQFAATVRRNAAAFGGGLLKIAKPRAAITWPAASVKMVRELIQDHDYAGALDLAGAKCGAMFYQHKKEAFMLLAPVECSEIPGMMSAQNEKGHFVVFEPVSGFEIAGAYGSKDKTRAAAIAGALAKWNASTNQVAAIEKAHATPCDQQAARLAWMTEHGIQHQEEITARIEAAAAQDVAQVIEAATMAASTATEAQPWHTTSQTRELVTACEGVGDHNQAAGHTPANHHAPMGTTTHNGTTTPPPARPYTPQGADYTTQRETLGELHDTPQVIEPATAKRMAGEVAQNAPKTAETTPTAPVDVKNLIEAGYPSTVAEIIAKSGIDAYGPMAQAEILEKLATAKHSQDAPTRYRFKPGVMVQKINSKSGKWMAEFRLTPIGRFELGFKVGSGCSLSTTYATASKRMQALQAMAREADTPTPPTTYDAPPATTGTTEEADYTTARETSSALHDTPQNLEKTPTLTTPTKKPKARAMMPEGAEHTASESGHWEAWIKTNFTGRVTVLFYVGAAFNPTHHYSYKTIDQAREAVQRFAKDADAIAASRAKAKANKREAMDKPHGLAVGDVLHSSWGYDQTNTDHYQITAVIGKRTVEVRKLAQQSEGTGYMCGVCVPVPGQFVGEAMRRQVDQYGSVNVLRASFGRASKVEPVTIAGGVRVFKPVGWSSYA